MNLNFPVEYLIVSTDFGLSEYLLVSGKPSHTTGSWKNHQIKIIYLSLIMQNSGLLKKTQQTPQRQTNKVITLKPDTHLTKHNIGLFKKDPIL